MAAINYNFQKSYQEQADDVREALQTLTKATPTNQNRETVDPGITRPKWQYWDSEGVRVRKDYRYQNPPESKAWAALDTIVYTVSKLT